MEVLKNLEAVLNCKDPKLVKAIKVEGYDLDSIAEKISQFVNLTRFECTAGYEVNLPEGLFKLKKIKDLTLSNLFLKTFPIQICTAFPLLETLNLSQNYFSVIPNDIRKLKRLHCLNLHKTTVKKLPEVLLELKSLKSLIVSTYDLGADLSVLLAMKGLTELVLAPKLLKKLRKEEPDFIKAITYVYSHGKLEKKKLKRVLNQFVELETTYPLRALILNLLSDQRDKLRESIQISDLLQACNFKGEEYIRLKALELLDEQMSEANRVALAQNAEVAVMGRLGINKNELRQKFKDLNIKYQARIGPTSSHVLVGQMPGIEVLKVVGSELFVLTEKNVNDFWEQQQNPYLLEAVEASPEQLESMSALLLSGQEDSIAVALAMFKQGGFPKELITELFIAYFQLLVSSDVEREAKRLLRQYGSSELVASLKKGNRLFSPYIIRDELALNREIMAICKKTELDDLKLARFLYKNIKLGAAYLIRKLPEIEAITFIRTELLTLDGKLDLSRKRLRSIPKVLYKIATEIEYLDLSGNSVQKLTKDFAKFKNLKEINLIGNYDLMYMDGLREESAGILTRELPNCKVILRSNQKTK